MYLFAAVGSVLLPLRLHEELLVEEWHHGICIPVYQVWCRHSRSSTGSLVSLDSSLQFVYISVVPVRAVGTVGLWWAARMHK